MPLCNLCDGLTIAGLYPPNHYLHVENRAALQASAEVCRLCKMIDWSVRDGFEAEHKPQLMFEGATDETTRYGEEEVRDKCSIKVQIIPGSWNESTLSKGFTHIGIWMQSKYMCADLTVNVEGGDPLAVKANIGGGADTFVSGRVLVSDIPPPAFLDRAQAWYEYCKVNHPVCGDSAAGLPSLPERVICIGDGSEPYLMNGKGVRAEYATLSHCWGASQPLVTTMENISQRQQSIDIEALPKTFREAIIVCRRLAIPYLWIDSLCIIQDDKGDWEHHSSIMGSIYFDSCLTIAATDAPDSTAGLFISRRPSDYCWNDIITLPSTFGDSGQAYITAPSWGVYGPPASEVACGILQSRGWTMQEKCLARRTIHFLEGQIVWECCERIIGQSGFNESLKSSFRKSFRVQMSKFKQAFDTSYRFAEPGDDTVDDDEEEEEREELEQGSEDEIVAEITGKSVAEDGCAERSDGGDDTSQKSAFVTTLTGPDNGRTNNVVDFRIPLPQNNSIPAPITRYIDNELYNFLDVASRQTIYHVWYSAVERYSRRRLTISSDKLPALAGIAARVQTITQDQYIAGHWRRELERSLFWMTSTEPDTWTPGRTKAYRAPSWSWASVDGDMRWNFADLAPGRDLPAPIQVLDVTFEVDGQNPFGCVGATRLVMQASITRAVWNVDSVAWILQGQAAGCGETQYGELPIMSNGNEENVAVGRWYFDDLINGIMPGPSLTAESPEQEVQARRVPNCYFGATKSANNAVWGKDFIATPMWERGTYLPEELLLVKGPTKMISEYRRDFVGGRESIVEVLVLARTDAEGEFRRVGVGKLGSWDEAAESVETLTLV